MALTVAVSACFAQKHDAISIFGYGNASNEAKFGGANIDFNFDPPKIYKQKKKIDVRFHCACCSDSTGKLLFYTNGISIQNGTHNLMANGDSINFSDLWKEFKVDGYPSVLGAEAIPFPGHPNQYVLIHVALRYVPVEDDLYFAPLMYSIVDMNANNGLGRVLKKNQVMVDSSLTDFVLIKHGNGRDWWVLTAQRNTTRHYTFLIHPGGVSGPYIQNYGPAYPGFPKEWGGFCTASEDGTLYVRHDGLYGPRIYDFDRCTGLLSNLRLIPYKQSFYTVGSVLSQDKKTLYLSSYGEMMSVDLTHPDPASTLDTIAEYDGFATPVPLNTGFWSAQPRDNGKVYYATTNGTLALHVLHRAGMPGQAADFQQHAITLPVYNSGTMCRFPNYRLGRWLDAPCDTLGFHAPPPGFVDTPYEPNKAAQGSSWTVYPPIVGDGRHVDPAWEPKMFGLHWSAEIKRAREAEEAQKRHRRKKRKGE